MSDANLHISDLPIALPERLSITAPTRIATTQNQTIQLAVTSHQIGGSTLDVTSSALGTTYMSSNLDIVHVDANGLCTALSEGSVFVTAQNDGVAAVIALEVSPGDPLTEVVGVVQLEDGSPAAGAEVNLSLAESFFQASVMAGPDGSFTIPNVPTLRGEIRVWVTHVVGPVIFRGSADGVVPTSPQTVLPAPIVVGQDTDFVLIPAGPFQMGDTFGEGGSDELPVHTVTLSAFEIGKYEVTNEEVADVFSWALGQGLVTATASSLRGVANNQEYLDLDSSSCQISWDGSQLVVDVGKEDYPCVEISWWGSIGFCNARSHQDGLQACYNLTDGSCDFSRNGWRLPTEAEWEKAARGGVAGQRFPHGDTIGHADANYHARESSLTYDNGPGDSLFHPTWNTGTFPYTSLVGTFAANGYGLYDMAGNVWEWCSDWYGWTSYGSSPGTDPTGPSTGSDRVLRGGSWFSGADGARCADRLGLTPTNTHLSIGFRLARGR